MIGAIDTVQIKQRTDLRELVELHTTLSKCARREWAGACPKCGGTDRLHVNDDGWWMCRKCHPKRADVIEFVMWLEGCNFKSACAGLGGPGLPDHVLTEPPAAMQARRPWADPAWQAAARQELARSIERLEAPEGEAGRAYLLQRGIQSATWQAWGLGYATPWHAQRGANLPAIVVPWRGRGTLKALQYRFFAPEIDKSGRFRQRAGGERTIFGSDLLGRHFQTLVCVEGELNALSIWQTARNMDLQTLDVVSFGSEGSVTNPKLLELAGRYRHVLIWADEEEWVRRCLRALPEARGLKSPDGRDANDLLLLGILDAFLQRALSRFFGQVIFAGPSVAEALHPTSPAAALPASSVCSETVALPSRPAQDPYTAAIMQVYAQSDEWWRSGFSLDWMAEHCPLLWDQVLSLEAELERLYGQSLDGFRQVLTRWAGLHQEAAWRFMRWQQKSNVVEGAIA
jgi:hypothetical protein